MPFPQILGDIGALATKGMRIPRVGAKTPPMLPPGLKQPSGAGMSGPLPEPTLSANSPRPDGTDTDSGSTGLPMPESLKQPPMTPGMQQLSDLYKQGAPAPATGIRGKIGGVFNALGWNWAGNPLKYPGLDVYQGQVARAKGVADLEDEALKRQEAQQRIAESMENMRAMRDYRQNVALDKAQGTYDRRMDNIQKAGGFEAPTVPPSTDRVEMPNPLTEIPAGSGIQGPDESDVVRNLPQRNLILSPGLRPEQSSSLGSVENLKDPSTGQTTPMVRPNLKTQAEMRKVDAPQDIVDFYKGLPPEFTKNYPVSAPNVPPDGKMDPAEVKRLESKYQRDSAALQAWNAQRGKPASSAQNKEEFQNTMAKIASGGLPAGAITNVQQQVSAIRNASNRGLITPVEANNAIAYLAANTTPAAQGTNTVIRVEGMGDVRVQPVLDTKNGNAPTYLSINEINKANRNEPGRYIPAAQGTQALNKATLLEDIRGNVQQTRESLAQIPDFSGMDRAKIAMALRSRDPHSALSSLITSGSAGSLTPAQQDYLINITNLVENAMAMRSVLGAGQGSDELRTAITAVIPGPTTPSKEYALKQLATFEKTLNRLERGVPKVPLRTDVGGGAQTVDVTDPTGTVHHFPTQQAADAFKQAAGIK